MRARHCALDKWPACGPSGRPVVQEEQQEQEQKQKYEAEEEEQQRTSPEPSGPAIAGAFGEKTPENNTPRLSRFSDCRGLHHDTPSEERQQQRQEQQRTSPVPSDPAIAGAFGAKTSEKMPRVSMFSDCRGLHHDTPGMVEIEKKKNMTCDVNDVD